MTAKVEYHFGPHATQPDPEAKVEAMTFKHEEGGARTARGPLFVGDWKEQALRPYATVTWEDGTSGNAWVTLPQARAIAKAFSARLVEF